MGSFWQAHFNLLFHGVTVWFTVWFTVGLLTCDLQLFTCTLIISAYILICLTIQLPCKSLSRGPKFKEQIIHQQSNQLYIHLLKLDSLESIEVAVTKPIQYTHICCCESTLFIINAFCYVMVMLRIASSAVNCVTGSWNQLWLLFSVEFCHLDRYSSKCTCGVLYLVIFLTVLLTLL